MGVMVYRYRGMCNVRNIFNTVTASNNHDTCLAQVNQALKHPLKLEAILQAVQLCVLCTYVCTLTYHAAPSTHTHTSRYYASILK